jgi:hypothetical protein
MKRSVLAGALALAAVLTGCVNAAPIAPTATDPPPTATPAQQRPETSELAIILDESVSGESAALLYIGMPRSEAFEALVSGVMADSERAGTDFWSPIDDGAHHDAEFDGVYYIADKNDALYYLSVWAERLVTKAGLRVGDSLASVGALYGDAFTAYTDVYFGDEMREYVIGNNYIAVYFADGRVVRWSASQYGEEFLRAHTGDSVPSGDN